MIFLPVPVLAGWEYTMSASRRIPFAVGAALEAAAAAAAAATGVADALGREELAPAFLRSCGKRLAAEITLLLNELIWL
jgi:hypothetical protein